MTRLFLTASLGALVLAACGQSETAPDAAAETDAQPTQEAAQPVSSEASASDVPTIEGPSLEEILTETDAEARMTLLDARARSVQDAARAQFERHVQPLQGEIEAILAAMETAQSEIDAAARANIAPIIADARGCEGGAEGEPAFDVPDTGEMTPADANLIVTAALMEAADASACVFELPSGMRIRVDRAAAEGQIANPGEIVEVHYEGKLPNGEIFDSSYQRGEPARFPSNGVISGWVEALGQMRVGEQWTLFIPADLGYGAMGRGGIGPNEAMIFKVELLDLPNRMIQVEPVAPEGEDG